MPEFNINQGKKICNPLSWINGDDGNVDMDHNFTLRKLSKTWVMHFCILATQHRWAVNKVIYRVQACSQIIVFSLSHYTSLDHQATEQFYLAQLNKLLSE